MSKYSDERNERLQRFIGSTNEKAIYHYTSVEGLKSILKNKTLWLSDIFFMNDESEIKYTFELVFDYLDSVKKFDEEFKNPLKDIYKNLNESNNDIKFNYYIISFSLNGDSLPIWIYYTKNPNSSGYNIKFDKEIIIKIIKNYSQFGCFHGLVIYNKKKQMKIIRDVLNENYKNFMTHPNATELNSSKKISIFNAFNDLQLLSLFFKSSYFKNEEEYRIVIPVFQVYNTPSLDLDFRINNGMLIPYTEISFKDNIECIKGITISPSLKSSLIEKGLREFIISEKYQDLSIIRSQIPIRY